MIYNYIFMKEAKLQRLAGFLNLLLACYIFIPVTLMQGGNKKKGYRYERNVLKSKRLSD